MKNAITFLLAFCLTAAFLASGCSTRDANDKGLCPSYWCAVGK